MSVTLEVSYFNTFWIKRLKDRGITSDNPIHYTGITELYRSSTGLTNPHYDSAGALTTAPPRYDENVYEDWFIEEARIRGGFNNTSVDFGNKAYIVEENEKQERLENKLIHSGVYNSRTGINNTNQFPIGEDITRAVDPASGSVQKLYAENTNLLILQERKVNRAPIDKDVIFTQEGQPLTANSQLVIGTPSPFEGNFGISKDPGSFAVYGYNKYFTDKDRSAVLKLGPSGIEEISNQGMIDYFRDTLAEGGDIVGGYDIYNKNYVLTLGNPTRKTLAYDQMVNGWISFFDYIPELLTSCVGNFYTFKNQKIWKHYVNSNYNNFYGVAYGSTVTFVFNPEPTRMKTFKTISYEGSNGWEVPVNEVKSEFTGVDTNPQQPALGDTNLQDTIARIYSYDEGYYTESGVQYRAGFDRKQNTYYAAIKNNSGPRPGEVIFDGSNQTGIKAFYATVKFATDATTDPNGPKQLFSVGSVYNTR
jgi:hypothetical protein